MFGAGKEPGTVEEFLTLVPPIWYAYDEGKINSNKTVAVEVTGRNQWDEEWEVGSIDRNSGNNSADTSRIRSKNFSPALSSAQYYLRVLSGGGYVFYYDGNKEYITYRQLTAPGVFDTPQNCHYFRFVFTTAYGTTYKNDICINLSDPSFNGQYEPYKKDTVELNLPTLTGKLNGEGESVVVYPDGMRGARAAYDKAAGKRGEVVMAKYVFTGNETILLSNWRPADGTYAVAFAAAAIPGFKPTASNSEKSNSILVGIDNKSYQEIYNGTVGATLYNGAYSLVIRVPSSIATDNASLLAWLTGKEIIYELAEPLVYELDESIEKTFEVEAGGTERRLPEDTATVVNAPFYGTVQYPIALQPKDTISNDSLTALLTALKSAGKIANYTMTWDAATNSYKFTIS